MAREWRWGGYRGAALGACVLGGTAAVLGGGLWLNQPRQTVAAIGARDVPQQVSIASPRPFFMQVSGQGPALSGTRVVWTATTGQGGSGSEADRIYAYDLSTRRLSVLVHSSYGAVGFIGSYALVGSQLAYVDTGFAPGGIFTWRVNLMDLHNGHEYTLATSPAGDTATTIPPQIAFDGAHVLMVLTTNVGTTQHGGSAILFTPARRLRQVVASAANVEFSDPALATNAALWTSVSFTPSMSSRLTAYDMTRHTLRTLPVGNVSELAASGDMVAWKSGPDGTSGHIGLYSLRSGRVIAGNLAHSNNAIFPSIGGRMVSWTYGDGSRVQVYSLGSQRVIYSAPVVKHRIYGPTALASNATSWVYTALPVGKGASQGYVVIRQIR